MRKIILYGAGRNGVRYLKWLAYCGIAHLVCAFCDKNAERLREINGIRVLSYQNLRKEADADWLLTADDHEEMERLCGLEGLRYYSSFADYVRSVHPDNKRALELISERPIAIDEFDQSLSVAYGKSNYKIVHGDSKEENTCYIFFSGNGIYRSNTLGELRKTIYAEDRFEWEYVANLSGIIKTSKCIFVRDVYKNFYVNGISKKYDDIDKLLEFLRSETSGYIVRTVGNSAGGYMAMLAGSILGAEIIFSFSGIVDLYHYNDAVYGNNYYFMKKYRDAPGRSRYFDIIRIVNADQPVMFFYAANNDEDVRQANKIKEKRGVVFFPVSSSEHGKTIRTETISKLFTFTRAELYEFCKKNSGFIKDPSDY